jgi:hypothetical protein
MNQAARGGDFNEAVFALRLVLQLERVPCPAAVRGTRYLPNAVVEYSAQPPDSRKKYAPSITRSRLDVCRVCGP